MRIKKALALSLLAAFLLLLMPACAGFSEIASSIAPNQDKIVPIEDDPALPGETATAAISPAAVPDEYGIYTSQEEVSLYLFTYGRLPENFITKEEARALGWNNGSLKEYAPGKCIGGDRFGNYEGLLPETEGRKYYECDIDTLDAPSRNAKRIVFSNDGLIYYTDDHYESFVLLYGDESR